MERHPYRNIIIIIIFFFSLNLFGQDIIISETDKATGEIINFIATTKWISGEKMDDSMLDGVVYIKKNGKYYKRSYSGLINVKWFSAKGDGILDDTKAFEDAVKFIKKSNGGALFIPKGMYRITKPLVIDFDNLVLQGEGSKNSVLQIYHSGVAISYKSKIPDLSTARFNLYGIGIVNKINNSALPHDNMTGIAIHCNEMHSSDWKDVYIENFSDALILEQSYLNIFINYFAQSNWRGLKTIKDSNGNTFYNGAQRNSSIDLRGKGSEKNLFINIDIEPASNTQYVGNNNTFQNCRFERFNLLHKDYKKPWFILGSKNKFTKCDWHWNFEDQPKDYMMIVEGEGNEIEIGKTNTTPKLVLFKETSSNNELIYKGEFDDYEVTNTLRYSDNLIQDLGNKNNIKFQNKDGISEYFGDLNFVAQQNNGNIINKNWWDEIEINMNTMSFSFADIESPLGFSKNETKKVTIINDNYVRRSNLLDKYIANGKSKYSASAWLFIPKDFNGKYVSISIVEGQYIMLHINKENMNKWVRVFGYAYPKENEEIKFSIDTDAKRNCHFYISLPVLSRSLNANPT